MTAAPTACAGDAPTAPAFADCTCSFPLRCVLSSYGCSEAFAGVLLLLLLDDSRCSTVMSSGACCAGGQQGLHEAVESLLHTLGMEPDQAGAALSQQLAAAKQALSEQVICSLAHADSARCHARLVLFAVPLYCPALSWRHGVY